MALNKAQRRISGLKHDVHKAYNTDGVLLYVGISVNVFKRLKEHKQYAEWHPHSSRIDVVQYRNRDAARAEEARCIRSDNPLYNRTRENAWGCELSDDTVETFTLWRDEDGWYIDDEG